MKKTVTTTSLELTARSELHAAAGERQYTLMRAEIPSPAEPLSVFPSARATPGTAD